VQTCKEILASIGWPTDYLVLDFETYFEKKGYTLKDMSTWEYLADPRFEFTGLSLCMDGCGPQFVAPDDIPVAMARLARVMDDTVIIMQNAKFDATILAVKFGLHPRFVVDTKDLAKHLDARGSKKLKDLAAAFGLEAKGDTTQFAGQHWEDMNHEDMEVYAKQDSKLELQLFELLLPRVTNPSMELPIATAILRYYTQPRIEFDFEQARQLEVDMRAKFDQIIADTGFTKDEISGDKSFMVILQNALPDGEFVPMKKGKKGPIPAFAKTDLEMQQLMKHPDPKVQQLMQAREAVGSWPNHIKRVQRMVRMATAAGGFLPVPLGYYSAHTGRLGGMDKINLQNLGGRGRAGHGNDPLIGKVRQLLRAPKGKKLVIVDSAQIEARVLAWLAGQIDLVEDFARGRDVYSKFATRLFQAKVCKPKPYHPAPLVALFTIRRGFGKDAILGCGYGMGDSTFYDRCVENPDLKPLFTSGAYDFSFISGLIKTYRAAYPSIPSFWKSIEKMFTFVTRFPNEVMRWSGRESMRAGPNDVLTLWNDSGTVNLQLPSGRCLFYKHAQFNVKAKQLRYHYGPLWGGTLTENAVQAIARDLLMHWILECGKAGIDIVHQVHDEAISVIEEDRAQWCLDTMMQIFRAVPGWAEGCPVDAEGMIADAYTK